MCAEWVQSHLPAFGGYAPWALAEAQNATNRTHGVSRGVKAAIDTAWIDGRDPLYTAVADAWMKQVTADFGSDHVWQMDGFFADGSSWGATDPTDPIDRTVPCTWSAAKNNTYLAGYVHSGPLIYPTMAEAKAACVATSNIANCNGIVSRHDGGGKYHYELRAGHTPIAVPASDGEASYVITNRAECTPLAPTEIWRNRSAAAYSAVTRVDGPSARWIYQGYALVIGK